jgi:thymidylate synthase
MRDVIENWPVEYYDQLILGNPASNIAVCCLWSDKTKIKTLLPSNKYAVIGNLYSRAGINPMLRNVLANPSLRYLILTGKSLTDSDEALINFFELGVDAEWRILRNGGQLERDLPIEVLDQVRTGVELIDLRRSSDLTADFHKIVAQLEVKPPFSTPKIFPKTPPVTETFPSEFVGFTIRQRTIFKAWCEAVWAVMRFGHVSPTDYGVGQKEVLGILSIIEEPAIGIDKFPLWAPYKKDDVKSYLNRFFEAEYNEEVAYNYGHRLQSYWELNQIEQIAAELRRSSFSRRALASLWDPVKDSKSADPPCLTAVQAALREGNLHLTAFIRSNDSFRAFPLNAASLAELQVRIAGQLNDVKIGSLAILSYSSHIYSDCWDACQPLLKEAELLHHSFEQDPRGSFVFRQEGEYLVAEHYSPEGDLLQTFEAKSGRDLASSIAPFVSRVDHGIYLGREIDRLAAAVTRGMLYVQDEV